MEVPALASADELPPEDDTPPSPPKAPPSLSRDADVTTRLAAWKERTLRLEQLLTKKNAKIHELEETETKLKRLLAMAKRSIENSRQEILEKEDAIQTLQRELEKKHVRRPPSYFVDASTREPRQVVAKVAHGDVVWCLVEYKHDQDDDDVAEAEDEDGHEWAWHCFHSHDEIQAYVNRASGEPVSVPDNSLTPFEVERVTQRLKEEIERVQEEFRRYRVRSEITRKQHEAENRKLTANVVAKQTKQIAETDVAEELQSSKVLIRRLTKAQAEAEEREATWRRKFEQLMKEYDKLSGTMGETALAMEWRERYEQSVREKHELEKKLDELKLWSNGGGENSINGTGELQSLRNEFAQYRKRALLAVEQKEKELSEMQAQYHETGGGSSTTSRSNSFRDTLGRRMSAESNPSLSGFESLHATKTNEYLKNIVYKYMTSDQVEAKEHMEKAIATVLNFTPSELASIQDKRNQQGWFW